MTPYLLDANVAIALAAREHVDHRRANGWLQSVERAAMSAIVEGALVRYLVRVGVASPTAAALVRAAYDDPRIEFWSDDLSYGAIDLTHVVGHRQVTDTYLAALAVHHGGVLATFDRALAQSLPAQTFLIPD